MTANLDALLDMLDAEVSDDEEAGGGEQQKNVNQSDLEIDEDVIAGLDEVLLLRSGSRYRLLKLNYFQPFEEGGDVNEEIVERDVAVPASDAAEALPDNNEEGNEDDDQSEMERQLKQMQEQVVTVISAPKKLFSTCTYDPFQMAAMQRKLAEKKLQKKASNGEKGSSAAGKSSAAAPQQQNAPTPKQRKIVSQVDMFTKSSSSSAHVGPRLVCECVLISEVRSIAFSHVVGFDTLSSSLIIT